jgi:hypothetical protein
MSSNVITTNTYFCVLSTSTGAILYAGTSEAATAAALEPGTVYGYGRTRRAAWWGAVHRRADVLRSEGERGGVPEYVEAAEEHEP